MATSKKERTRTLLKLLSQLTFKRLCLRAFPNRSLRSNQKINSPLANQKLRKQSKMESFEKYTAIERAS